METKDLHRTKALAQLGVRSTRANPVRLPSKSIVKKEDYIASVLCVDDEPSAREFESEILRSNGYLVRTAGSVDEAIAVMESSGSIDIALLDLRMPGRDGFDLLDFIDKNLRFKHIAAIVVSSCGQVGFVRKAVEHGACGFLIKPITKDLLLQRVTEVLDTRRSAVLIISSDEVASRILEQVLARDKCTVFQAPTARDALQMLAKKRVDVIICDLGLADSTGPECLLGIREIDCFAPVFFLDDPESRVAEQDVVAVGAQGLIRRPFSGPDITNQVRGALQTHRSKRADLPST